MKYIRYSKYTGEPADAVDLEELIKRLGDFFLQSGFESQYYGVSEFDPEKTMEALRAGDSARARRKATCCPKICSSNSRRKARPSPTRSCAT